MPSERMKIDQLIIVEGRYDKAKLAALVDATILTTDGFGIFRDRDKLTYIRKAAKRRGVIILTDSDAAGFRIRAYLKGSVQEGKVLQAYIPDRLGKERRKDRPGAEGKLGVEGMEPEVLLEALRRAGASGDGPAYGNITRADFYRDGLLGHANSADARRKLAKRLSLPTRMSTTALLEAVNLLMTQEEYKKGVEGIPSPGVDEDI